MTVSVLYYDFKKSINFKIQYNRTWYDLYARKVETNLKSYPLHVHLQFTTYRTYDELNFCFAFL